MVLSNSFTIGFPNTFEQLSPDYLHVAMFRLTGLARIQGKSLNQRQNFHYCHVRIEIIHFNVFKNTSVNFARATPAFCF